MESDELKALVRDLNKPKPPTLEQVADAAGVSASTVFRLKRGMPVTTANAKLIRAGLDSLGVDK